ncbi:MAG TPA: hypothetical protein VNG33_20135, partial [Polyangiaceae bacterium]|nr:hypothetical protein [Polyangiaceae bacterium]
MTNRNHFRLMSQTAPWTCLLVAALSSCGRTTLDAADEAARDDASPGSTQPAAGGTATGTGAMPLGGSRPIVPGPLGGAGGTPLGTVTGEAGGPT